MSCQCDFAVEIDRHGRCESREVQRVRAGFGGFGECVSLSRCRVCKEESVIAAAPQQSIVASITTELIVATAPIQRIVVGTAVERVISRTAQSCVVACSGVEDDPNPGDIDFARIQLVIPVITVDDNLSGELLRGGSTSRIERSIKDDGVLRRPPGDRQRADFFDGCREEISGTSVSDHVVAGSTHSHAENRTKPSVKALFAGFANKAFRVEAGGHPLNSL